MWRFWINQPRIQFPITAMWCACLQLFGDSPSPVKVSCHPHWFIWNSPACDGCERVLHFNTWPWPLCEISQSYSHRSDKKVQWTVVHCTSFIEEELFLARQYRPLITILSSYTFFCPSSELVIVENRGDFTQRYGAFHRDRRNRDSRACGRFPRRRLRMPRTRGWYSRHRLLLLPLRRLCGYLFVLDTHDQLLPSF